MRILFVEDSMEMVKIYKPLLEKELNAEVVHFAWAKAAVRALYDMDGFDPHFDLIVCDHYMPLHEDEGPRDMGNYVYAEVQTLLERDKIKKPIPFIHFSSMPCMNKYEGANNDKNFFVVQKGGYDRMDIIHMIRQHIIGVDNEKDQK